MQGSSEKASPAMTPFQYPLFWLGETSWWTLVFKNKLFLGFFFFWLCHMPCGISVPPLGIEPLPLQWKHRLNHWTPGKVPVGNLWFHNSFHKREQTPASEVRNPGRIDYIALFLLYMVILLL